MFVQLSRAGRLIFMLKMLVAFGNKCICFCSLARLPLVGFLIHHILDDAAMADAPGRVYTCTLAFWKGQKMHKERWNDTGEQPGPEIQRNSNKVQDGCVSDLLCLLVELVEKLLDPAGVVWMDRLQVLNLHKAENNDLTRHRRVDCNYSNTDSQLANRKWKKKKLQTQAQHLQKETQNPKPQEVRVFCTIWRRTVFIWISL